MKEVTKLVKKIEFHGRMSKSAEKIIIIIPKEYHDRVRDEGFLNKIMKFQGVEVLD